MSGLFNENLDGEIVSKFNLTKKEKEDEEQEQIKHEKLRKTMEKRNKQIAK